MASDVSIKKIPRLGDVIEHGKQVLSLREEPPLGLSFRHQLQARRWAVRAEGVEVAGLDFNLNVHTAPRGTASTAVDKKFTNVCDG